MQGLSFAFAMSARQEGARARTRLGGGVAVEVEAGSSKMHRKRDAKRRNDRMIE